MFLGFVSRASCRELRAFEKNVDRAPSAFGQEITRSIGRGVLECRRLSQTEAFPFGGLHLAIVIVTLRRIGTTCGSLRAAGQSASRASFPESAHQEIPDICRTVA
jgi:hypothetical protein